MTAPTLVEHFFWHEYGRLVAMLSRRMEVQHIETIEVAVQSAVLADLYQRCGNVEKSKHYRDVAIT